ncbi:MAG TPA: aminotransferase class V-fold PLP-dependent enzyme [Longimicrobiales bacterium]|nr:aminotransferase class V-fold PLP-dependent enzyme [Longimicrobiales bacterium]
MSKPPAGLELDPETMRALGYRVVDALVERLTGLERAPAWRGASRGAMDALLAEAAPAAPAWDRAVGGPAGTPPSRGEDADDVVARSFDALLERLRRDVLEHAGRIDHPRFFAFVPSSPTWPSVLGDFLAAGYNVFQGTWLESAGPSALELVVLGWFRDWLGMPPSTAGILTSGGSAANLTALACARHAHGDGVLYLSTETHSSVARAARILGFPDDRVRALPADRDGRLQAEVCRAAIAEDRRAGRRPLALVASAGATSTGAVDPLGALAEVAEEEGVWLHVDAAYGGFAVLTAEGRELLAGIERADSVTLDPHKWLFQPYEAGCLLVREGPRLRDAFHILPAYLQDTAVAGGEVNFAERGPQLTRMARAVKIWLSVQLFGLDAFRAAIEEALRLARRAEERIRRSAELELATPARLGIVCFRRRASEESADSTNEALVRALAESGLGMISSTRVDGRYALRLCILNHRSRWEDVERVLTFLEETPTPG